MITLSLFVMFIYATPIVVLGSVWSGCLAIFSSWCLLFQSVRDPQTWSVTPVYWSVFCPLYTHPAILISFFNNGGAIFFLLGNLCHFGLEFEEQERLGYHQSPEAADLTQHQLQKYCPGKDAVPSSVLMPRVPAFPVCHPLNSMAACIGYDGGDRISISSSHNNALQSCCMELFIDKSNKQANGMAPFLYSMTCSSPPTVSGSRTMRPCMCQGDGWYLQCLHLSAASMRSCWTLPRGCWVRCHWIRKAALPLPSNVLFSPNTKYFNGNNDTHYVLWWITHCTFILNIPDSRTLCFCLVALFLFFQSENEEATSVGNNSLYAFHTSLLSSAKWYQEK